MRLQEKLVEQLDREIEILNRELRQDIPRELAEAIAKGDLSENAEYEAAKERKSFLEARISQLGRQRTEISMMSYRNIPNDRIGFGTTVDLIDLNTNKKLQYELVVSVQADPKKGKISATSPIGKALMNQQAGDIVEVSTPTGEKEFEIIDFETIYKKMPEKDQKKAAEG